MYIKRLFISLCLFFFLGVPLGLANDFNDDAPSYEDALTKIEMMINEIDRMNAVLEGDSIPIEHHPVRAAPTHNNVNTKIIDEKIEEKIVQEIITDVQSLQASPQPKYEEPIFQDIPPPRKPSFSHITGEVKMGVGFDSENTLWKKANYDLNERNFRIISDDQLNNKENTYDPGIYDRFQMKVDLKGEDSPLSIHSHISVDPWSFTAKTPKTTITGAGGDRAEIEALYWANTGYTVNQVVNTLDNGDGFALKEMKISGHRVLPATITSTFNNPFTIPEMKLEHQFQPLREFWVDYMPDEAFKLRVFPLAFQDMALTSDDPLHLSNNRTFWEESPWLANWKPGNFNSGGGDFTKGEWDDSLAFFTRDSDGTRLTALRGLSLDLHPSENTSIQAVVAAPKDLWQDYEQVESLPSSLRVKHFLTDAFYVGGLSNLHLGFNDHEIDTYNYVGGIDTGIALNKRLSLDAQVSSSFTKQDMTNNTFETKKRGNAYYLGLTATTLSDDTVTYKRHDQIIPFNDKVNYGKARLYYAQMDDGFTSSLSNYRETRDDSYWGRHLHFRRPMDTFFSSGQTGLNWHDIKPFAVGNGIDIGRYVIGWNSELSLWAGRLKGQTDIRNVHNTNHKFVENVVRTEWIHQTTQKLDTKLLLIRHNLPNTKGGVDPFLFDPSTGDYLINAAIGDGEDPSLETYSVGTQYDLTDKITWSSIWEYTNDFTAATDNYPRGLLNDSSFSTYQENNNTFRQTLPFLYSQGYFDLPPYEYHHIFKTGLNVRPTDKLDIYLDYTRNPNEFAGQIDDSMNHVGMELTYIPTTKLGIFFKYTWSRAYDIFTLVNDDRLSLENHHNVFTEARYNIKKNNTLTVQYGVGPSPTIASTTFDPFGGALPTVDTQHIFRIFYQKSF